MQPIRTPTPLPRRASARCALQTLASTLSDAGAAWLQRRRVRATARALGWLDDRLLRDLGLDRSEVLSAAAELHGQARPDRRHVAPAAQPPH